MLNQSYNFIVAIRSTNILLYEEINTFSIPGFLAEVYFIINFKKKCVASVISALKTKLND
jgi:hypothetical protein